MNSRKTAKQRNTGQIKIQETAFMLVALVFLFALVFIFYSRYESAKLFSEKEQLQKERAISLLSKLVAMPEFSCMHGTCIDADKLGVIKNISAYDKLWQGLSSVKVVRLYPANETKTYVIYKKGREDLTYSAYVPLCSTKYLEGYIWQDCDLAKLFVSIELPRAPGS